MESAGDVYWEFDVDFTELLTQFYVGRSYPNLGAGETCYPQMPVKECMAIYVLGKVGLPKGTAPHSSCSARVLGQGTSMESQ